MNLITKGQAPLITHDPDILGGKPVVAGTRMSVEAILESLAGGMEIDEMLVEFPFLSKAQILAALDYAAQVMSTTKGYIFPKNQTTTHEISRRR